MSISKKLFIASSLGTIIEYYDYALFVIFLPIITPVFFGADSAYSALVKGYIAIFITNILRPLGGIYLGYVGDVYGRRKALLLSMYGIAVATFIIGITPSYQLLGVLSVMIVILAKAVQVFCFGGEYNGAGIYVVEHAHDKQKVFIGSLLSASALLGSLLASLIGILLTAKFMPDWSWRIAFMLGSLVGLIGIGYRKSLVESPNFQSATNNERSLINLIKHNPKQLLAGFFIGGFVTIPFSTVFIFINPILTISHYFNNQQLMLIQCLLTIIAIISLAIAGKIGDRFSSYKVMLLGSLLLIFLSYPILHLVNSYDLIKIFIAEIWLIIINEIVLGPSNEFLKSLFPVQYRYRGSSLSFCLGMSILGGLTPIIENFLYQVTGNFGAISLWLIVIGLGTSISITLAK